MRISDWSSALCSSDLPGAVPLAVRGDCATDARLFRKGVFQIGMAGAAPWADQHGRADLDRRAARLCHEPLRHDTESAPCLFRRGRFPALLPADRSNPRPCAARKGATGGERARPPCCRSEEHTSELQTLIRISYAICCAKK